MSPKKSRADTAPSSPGEADLTPVEAKPKRTRKDKAGETAKIKPVKSKKSAPPEPEEAKAPGLDDAELADAEDAPLDPEAEIDCVVDEALAVDGPAAGEDPLSEVSLEEDPALASIDPEILPPGEDDDPDLDAKADADPLVLDMDKALEEVAAYVEDEELVTSDDVKPKKTLPAPIASGGRTALRDPLRLYMKEIGAFPMLGAEEEVDLAKRVKASGDQQAAFRLVSSHLRLVVKIALDFQRRWMQNVLDLIQEGNVGLMRAVQKFDPDKGIKFSYYAAFWIKAYILKFIMDNWRLVKIGTTQAQRKLFYNLNKERRRLQALGFDADAAALSKNLGVSEAEVREMEQRLGAGDLSLDATLGDDSTVTRLDVLPALTPGVETSLAKEEINALLRKHLEAVTADLTPKELEILKKRFLADPPATLREIGEQYGVTRERVRQLETRLLTKIRRRLSQEIGDFSKDWIIDED